MDINTAIKTDPDKPKARTLTVHDRCDICDAQALVRTSLKTGTLDWCGHHYAKNAEALAAGGADVINDDRDALAAEEGAASSHSIK